MASELFELLMPETGWTRAAAE